MYAPGGSAVGPAVVFGCPGQVIVDEGSKCRGVAAVGAITQKRAVDFSLLLTGYARIASAETPSRCPIVLGKFDVVNAVSLVEV